MADTIKRDNISRPIDLATAQRLGLKPVATAKQEAQIRSFEEMDTFRQKLNRVLNKIEPIPPAVDPSMQLAPLPAATESAAENILRRAEMNQKNPRFPEYKRQRRARMFRRDI